MSIINGSSLDSQAVLVNGVAGPLPNGLGHTPSTSNVEEGVVAPDIEHVTGNYMPLSRLFQRTAQECFNNLNETIVALADLPATQPVNRSVPTNGVNTSNGAVANSDKKLKWLNFANSNREKFIKLLVLLHWSRRVDEVSTLIDLVVWSNNQIQSYDAACHFMGEIKRGLATAKVPSPDIETALEALTLGDSERMPDVCPSLLPVSLNTDLSSLDTLRQILYRPKSFFPHYTTSIFFFICA